MFEQTKCCVSTLCQVFAASVSTSCLCCGCFALNVVFTVWFKPLCICTVRHHPISFEANGSIWADNPSIQENHFVWQPHLPTPQHYHHHASWVRGEASDHDQFLLFLPVYSGANRSRSDLSVRCCSTTLWTSCFTTSSHLVINPLYELRWRLLFVFSDCWHYWLRHPYLLKGAFDLDMSSPRNCHPWQLFFMVFESYDVPLLTSVLFMFKDVLHSWFAHLITGGDSSLDSILTTTNRFQMQMRHLKSTADLWYVCLTNKRLSVD